MTTAISDRQLSSGSGAFFFNSDSGPSPSSLSRSLKSTYLLLVFDPLVNGMSRGPRTVLERKNRFLNQCQRRHGYSTVLFLKSEFYALLSRSSRDAKNTRWNIARNKRERRPALRRILRSAGRFMKFSTYRIRYRLSISNVAHYYMKGNQTSTFILLFECPALKK